MCKINVPLFCDNDGICEPPTEDAINCAVDCAIEVGSVVRDLPNSATTGSTISVTLTVSNPGNYYIIEEIPPDRMVVQNSGELDNALGTKFRKVVYLNAHSALYTYTVKAPNLPGTYSFSGSYITSVTGQTKIIGGDISIIVV